MLSSCCTRNARLMQHSAEGPPAGPAQCDLVESWRPSRHDGHAERPLALARGGWKSRVLVQGSGFWVAGAGLAGRLRNLANNGKLRPEASEPPKSGLETFGRVRCGEEKLITKLNPKAA